MLVRMLKLLVLVGKYSLLLIHSELKNLCSGLPAVVK